MICFSQKGVKSPIKKKNFISEFNGRLCSRVLNFQYFEEKVSLFPIFSYGSLYLTECTCITLKGTCFSFHR